MLYICFTVDHELFFGNNLVSEEEVLIKPTYELMDILKKYNVPLTLMTDVCSMWKYKEVGKEEFAVQMERQLSFCIKNGHDVQLHLHPEWINATQKDGKWHFDFKKFKLHDFGFEKHLNNVSDNISSRDIIRKGKQYLESLLQPIKSDYSCIGYRAAGWSLQPEHDLLQALLDENIIIDTTTFKGGYKKYNKQYYDFRGLPKVPNWWINPQKGLKHQSDTNVDRIFEVSIGSYNNFPNVWLKKIKYKLIKKFYSKEKEKLRGQSLNHFSSSKKKVLIDKLKSFFVEPVFLSFDGATKDAMFDVIKYYINNFDCKSNDYYISMIGHPKNLTTRDKMEIEKLIKEINEKYSDLTEFITISDVYKKIKGNIENSN